MRESIYFAVGISKSFFCVILQSLMPTGILTKSTYAQTLTLNGVTKMLSFPLFKQESNI